MQDKALIWVVSKRLQGPALRAAHELQGAKEGRSKVEVGKHPEVNDELSAKISKAKLDAVVRELVDDEER